jgi:hypothetical protein
MVEIAGSVNGVKLLRKSIQTYAYFKDHLPILQTQDRQPYSQLIWSPISSLTYNMLEIAVARGVWIRD